MYILPRDELDYFSLASATWISGFPAIWNWFRRCYHPGLHRAVRERLIKDWEGFTRSPCSTGKFFSVLQLGKKLLQGHDTMLSAAGGRRYKTIKDERIHWTICSYCYNMKQNWSIATQTWRRRSIFLFSSSTIILYLALQSMRHYMFLK